MQIESSQHSTVLAVDIGTSGCRAFICNNDGLVVTTAARTYGITYTDSGIAEQNPEQIFDSFIEIIQQCIAESTVSVDYVVIGSVLHSLVLLDGDGHPLTPLSIWADTRAIDQCMNLKDAFELNKWHERTGCPLSPVYPLYRLLWLKDKKPELYNNFSKAVSIKSYIHFRLFGCYLEDHSVASGSGLFNIQERVWDKEILNYIGLDQEKLPEAVPVEYNLSGLKSSLKLGFSGRIKWIVGGADGPLAHLGTAGLNKNIASLTIGTSGAVRMRVDSPQIPLHSSLWCYVLTKDSYIQGLATNNGGNVIDWFVNAFYPAGTDWRELEERLTLTVSNSELFFIPFMFSERDFRKCNCNSAEFIGLKHWHTRDDMFRALLEGIAFNVIFLLDQLRQYNPAISEIAVSGGLARSEFVNKIFLATSTLKVTRGSVDNAVLTGLARIAICNKSVRFREKAKKNSNTLGVTDKNISNCLNQYYTEKYYNWLKHTSNNYRSD